MAELGFDLSNNNPGPFDFTKAKAAGYTFGWHKATEGNTFTDKYYVDRIKAMHDAGISPGAYHFARPAQGSAITQARFFVSVAKQAPIDRFALDLEDNGGLFAVPLSQWAVDFLTEAAKGLPGLEGWITSYVAFFQNNLGPHTDIIVPAARLWIADYPANEDTSNPPPTFAWPKLDMWQFSDHHNVPGIPEPVDASLAYLPLTSTPTAPTEDLMAQLDGTLAAARSQVGVLAGPNNDTPYSDWYQSAYPKPGNDYRGEAWCAMFVSWCWHHAWVNLQFAYCPEGVNAFKAFALFDQNPRPGDAVFYDWNHDGVADHVELVEIVFYDGSVQTIGGNSGTPDGVHRHLIGPNGDRAFSDVLGYGHPAYQ